MSFHAGHWQHRLDELRAEYHVPALAVLADGTLHELTSGEHGDSAVLRTPSLTRPSQYLRLDQVFTDNS
jgi:hypothetical protein